MSVPELLAAHMRRASRRPLRRRRRHGSRQRHPAVPRVTTLSCTSDGSRFAATPPSGSRSTGPT